jgi:hypothetical protein
VSPVLAKHLTCTRFASECGRVSTARGSLLSQHKRVLRLSSFLPAKYPSARRGRTIPRPRYYAYTRAAPPAAGRAHEYQMRRVHATLIMHALARVHTVYTKCPGRVPM